MGWTFYHKPKGIKAVDSIKSGCGAEWLEEHFVAASATREAVFIVAKFHEPESKVYAPDADGMIRALLVFKIKSVGIAVNAVSTQRVNVPVVVRDDTGAQVATDTITLAPNGHYAFTLGRDKYPATANIRGTIEFDTPAGAQIGAVGIRMPAGAAHTYTTLPALAK